MADHTSGDVLTDEILFSKLEHGGTVTVCVADNKPSFAYDSPPA